MKKRHEQKLVVLSIAMALLLNMPLILIFNENGAIFGFPTLYVAIFSVWFFSILFSFVIIKKHYE